LVPAIHEGLAEIARHGYIVLFAWITAERLGAPISTAPILIAAGVLSATSQLALSHALLFAILACLIGDSVWYVIGQRRGVAVLRFVCKISLEPDTCVRRSSNFISRYGSRSLLLAKFIPGVSAVAVPLAASSGISVWEFLGYDFLGAVLYTGAYLAAGRLLGDRIDKLSGYVGSLRSTAVALAILAALAIVGWRFYQRRRFRNNLKIARVTPDQVRDLIEREQKPYIVDLRHVLDMIADPRVIPGAVRFTPDELSARNNEIPRDREIILYCT
jgi:membrane protein DedA with SNARE-associated domain